MLRVFDVGGDVAVAIEFESEQIGNAVAGRLA
jgi:hypothetical protein